MDELCLGFNGLSQDMVQHGYEMADGALVRTDDPSRPFTLYAAIEGWSYLRRDDPERSADSDLTEFAICEHSLEDGRALLFCDGQAAKSETHDLICDCASLSAYPDFVSSRLKDDVDNLLAADPNLMYLHDCARSEGAPELIPGPAAWVDVTHIEPCLLDVDDLKAFDDSLWTHESAVDIEAADIDEVGPIFAANSAAALLSDMSAHLHSVRDIER